VTVVIHDHGDLHLGVVANDWNRAASVDGLEPVEVDSELVAARVEGDALVVGLGDIE
jgi:hypothetical protein